MNINLPTIEVTATYTLEVNGEPEVITADYSFTPTYDHDTEEELREQLAEELMEAWTDEHATPIDIDPEQIEIEVTDWDTIPSDYQSIDEAFKWAQYVEDAGSHGDSPEIILAALYCGIDASDIEEAYQGEHSSDEDFAREMADQLGAVDENAQWPMNCIDWEYAAKELMYDYSESNGHYFRNI